MEDQDLIFKIALTHIPMVGAVMARTLVSYCGSPKAVFFQKKSHLLKIPGIGEVVAGSIIRHKNFSIAEAELNFITKLGIKPVFYLDDDYPIRLKHIKDAPTLLYLQGAVDLNATRIVAIVGTRKPTAYGKNQCERMIDDLKSMDVLIVSGLAYGIDITAHRKALNVGLPTIGVLGSGLDKVYPASHQSTARQMQSNGGLLTEFGRGTMPDRENFPMRNRVIAGMCDALVVIESDVRGGSMITAEIANGYYKDVFAVPGKVGDQWSRGCNLLIKTDRAHLLESGEELAEIMQWKETGPNEGVQRSIFQDLDEREQLLCNMLTLNCPVSIDKLYKEADLTASEMASVLLGLEFKGIIKSLPGKMYMKV